MPYGGSPLVEAIGGGGMSSAVSAVTDGLFAVGSFVPSLLGVNTYAYKTALTLVGAFLVYVLLLIVLSWTSIKLPGSKFISGLSDQGMSAWQIDRLTGGGAVLGHASVRDDTGSTDGFEDASRSGRFLGRREDHLSSFLGSRESPYFGEVTNRTLQLEDRERAARDALMKINQERTRRGDQSPLAWAPFWDEWRKTHSLEGEGMTNWDERLGQAALAAY